MAKLKIVKTESGGLFEIEKGIPVPPPLRGAGRTPRYPLDKMKVGDSFPFNSKLRKRIAASAYQWGKRNNAKFALRDLGDGTGRCWRVK